MPEYLVFLSLLEAFSSRSPLRSIADALPVNTQSFHWSILIYTLHSRCIVQRLPHVGGCKASFARK